MKKSSLKKVVLGAIIGIIVAKIISKLKNHSENGGKRNCGPVAFADKIRGMNDEEYSAFKDRMSHRKFGRFCQENKKENSVNENVSNEEINV